MTTTCICLKFGTRYGPEYVNRLAAALVRHTPDARVLCMTDDRTGLLPWIEVLALPVEPFHDRMFAHMARMGWKAPMQKISLFRPDLIPDLDGALIVLDIDIVITGDVSPMARFAPGKVAMRKEWHSTPTRPSLGHGSVEKIEPQTHAWLYEDMARDPEAALTFGHGSEQSYTSLLADKHGALAHFPDEWIVSFKRDCRPPRPLNLLVQPRLPEAAKVVCFHGRPKIEEAIAGYRAGPLHSTRPCDWLRKAWMGDLA
ncbi:glycosyl transferase [Tabrizicola piscis]|uniref:Glycosyl transferase n=1 Tax=Tabrizicola piscis TaxID=2494374 RepID=A0A3S8UA30_9RHOB|nr:glycosyl transferase [Tabrizicola piscis]AZL60456.1 glycosyl transferase [Tabrizicola piscis]